MSLRTGIVKSDRTSEYQTDTFCMTDTFYVNQISGKCLLNIYRMSDIYLSHFLCQPNIYQIMSVQYLPNACHMTVEYLTVILHLPMSTRYLSDVN